MHLTFQIFPPVIVKPHHFRAPIGDLTAAVLSHWNVRTSTGYSNPAGPSFYNWQGKHSSKISLRGGVSNRVDSGYQITLHRAFLASNRCWLLPPPHTCDRCSSRTRDFGFKSTLLNSTWAVVVKKPPKSLLARVTKHTSSLSSTLDVPSAGTSCASFCFFFFLHIIGARSPVNRKRRQGSLPACEQCCHLNTLTFFGH